MCVTALVLASASMIAGTATSISTAKANKKMQQYTLDVQRKQLNEEREIAKLQAQEAEAARLDEYRRTRAANQAAIAASGIGQNISFLQGIEPASEKALKLDLRNIRMGDIMQRNRIADQIKVNQMSRQVASINARNASIGAVAEGITGIASAVQTYDASRV